MTVTKRKRTDPQDDSRPSTETGIRYTCDSCSADISHTVRIRCAQLGSSLQPVNGLTRGPTATEPTAVCEDFDLCGMCFCEGREIGRHKRWHDYRVVEQHAYPIFVDDWDRELLLIDACQTYGLGNWADIADHIGSYRTKEEVEAHYLQVYVASSDYPLPRPVSDLDINQDAFQERKKARLEYMQGKKPQMPLPKPLASAPTCHEVAGFMPGRLEFEHEFENDAETLIKDMDFGLVMRFGGEAQPSKTPDGAFEGIKMESREARGDVLEEAPPLEEDDDDLDMKLAILDIYGERYDRRIDAKTLIFDRALTEYKRIHTGERKRSKEERDLINRVKVFSRLQTAADAEVFLDGLMYEVLLRKRISDLQDYRKAGLTTLHDTERYEKEKVARQNARLNGNLRESLVNSNRRGPLTFGSRPLSAYDSREGTPQKAFVRRTNQPLTLASSSSIQLLNSAERLLCSEIRILPRPFFFVKQTLLREYARREGRLRKAEARDMLHIEDSKLERIWDLVIGACDPPVTFGTQSILSPSPLPDRLDVEKRLN